jgi:hypothetical protein
MGNTSLISQLFTQKQCKEIQRLYKDDPASHRLIYRSIGSKLLDSDKIINHPSIDILALLLGNNGFGASDEDCMHVAVFVYKSFFYESPLPFLSEGNTLEFSIKTLVSLSFFRGLLEQRMNRKGAPSPTYFREASKIVFAHHGYKSIGENHEKWECLISECLIY